MKLETIKSNLENCLYVLYNNTTKQYMYHGNRKCKKLIYAYKFIKLEHVYYFLSKYAKYKKFDILALDYFTNKFKFKVN